MADAHRHAHDAVADAPEVMDQATPDTAAMRVRSPTWLPLVGLAGLAVIGVLALRSGALADENDQGRTTDSVTSSAPDAPAPEPNAATTIARVDDETAVQDVDDTADRAASTPDGSDPTTESASDRAAERDPGGLPLMASAPRSAAVAPLGRALGAVDHLVALTPTGYAVVDTVAGRVFEVDLELDLVEVGAGLDTNTFYARTADGKAVYIVAGEQVHGLLANRVDYFAFSATPGRVWIGVPNIPDLVLETDQYGIYYDTRPRTGGPSADPRYVFEPGGGLYRMGGVDTALVDVNVVPTEFIGPHEPLATSDQTVVGRRCDASLDCWIEQRTEGGAWETVAAVDAIDRPTVEVSPDGNWIAISTPDDGVSLWSRVGGVTEPGVPLLRPEAEHAHFSITSDRVYLIRSDGLVTMVDLLSGEEQSTRLPRSLVGAARDWVALPALTSISP